MKKLMMTITLGLFILVLAACSQTAKPTENASSEKESELTLQEVFEKTMEASEKIESYSINMNMDQEMSISSVGESITMGVQTDMDVVNDPMSLYQKMKMDMNMEGTTQSVATESYLTEDGFYVYDDLTAQWTKLPQEMVDQVMQLSGEQMDPNAQMAQLEQFVEEFTFEQDDSQYILKLNASGANFMDLVKELSGDMLNQEQLGVDVFEQMTIDQLDYTIYVDKETFNPVKVDMVLNMKMDIEGEEMTVKQTSSGIYSNVNAVEAITVPAEVLETAVDAGY